MEKPCQCGIVHWEHKMGKCPSEETQMFALRIRQVKLCESCTDAYNQMLGAKSVFFLKDPTKPTIL